MLLEGQGRWETWDLGLEPSPEPANPVVYLGLAVFGDLPVFALDREEMSGRSKG